MNLSDCKLSRNAFGKLVVTTKDQIHEGVVPVRSFPSRPSMKVSHWSMATAMK